MRRCRRQRPRGRSVWLNWRSSWQKHGPSRDGSSALPARRPQLQHRLHVPPTLGLQVDPESFQLHHHHPKHPETLGAASSAQEGPARPLQTSGQRPRRGRAHRRRRTLALGVPAATGRRQQQGGAQRAVAASRLGRKTRETRSQRKRSGVRAHRGSPVVGAWPRPRSSTLASAAPPPSAPPRPSASPRRVASAPAPVPSALMMTLGVRDWILPMWHSSWAWASRRTRCKRSSSRSVATSTRPSPVSSA
mmetsp:Transcript_108787/g.347232  ORF Transcript_108787/g.347232 Transcript_108787/m.347232 type:complete len:248 (-) Transcript_108787:268-1011(-)